MTLADTLKLAQDLVHGCGDTARQLAAADKLARAVIDHLQHEPGTSESFAQYHFAQMNEREVMIERIERLEKVAAEARTTLGCMAFDGVSADADALGKALDALDAPSLVKLPTPPKKRKGKK